MAQAAAAMKQAAPTELPLSFTQVLPDAQEYPVGIAQKAADLCEAANRAVIDSSDAMEKGSTLDKMIQVQLKKGEEERTKLTGPLNQVVKILNAKFKAVSDPLEMARKTIQSKMLTYKREQDRLAAEAAEKARKEAEEKALSESLALEAQGKTEEATAVLEEAAEAPPPLPPAPAGPVRSDVGAVSSFVDDFKYEVTDLAQVPREYLCIDDRKVREAIKPKDGVREIAGLRIFNQPRMITR